MKEAYEGFLYRTEAGQWILCDAPNLKSCCLKQHAIVALEGDFSRYQPNQAVAVEGIYLEGRLYETAVHKKNNSFPIWSVGAICALVIIWGALRWRRGRPPPP